jgi:transcriptional regulator with XRE-family HTH domain
VPGIHEPIRLPGWAWLRTDMRDALHARDLGELFRQAQRYTGASQVRLASATGLTQARVNEVINGRRTITSLAVLERIADGLHMPDDARSVLGLAARNPLNGGGFGPAGGAEITSVYPSQAAAAEEIRLLARNAASVDILAVRGLGLLGLNDSLLRNAVSHPREDQPVVRVLLLDPDCGSARRRAVEIGEGYEAFAAGIRLAEARLRELAEHLTIEVYRYVTLPTWRLIGVDGTLFLSAFLPTGEGHESPTYKIPSSPTGVFNRGFRRMFDATLAASTRVV